MFGLECRIFQDRIIFSDPPKTSNYGIMQDAICVAQNANYHADIQLLLFTFTSASHVAARARKKKAEILL